MSNRHHILLVLVHERMFVRLFTLESNMFCIEVFDKWGTHFVCIMQYYLDDETAPAMRFIGCKCSIW